MTDNSLHFDGKISSCGLIVVFYLCRMKWECGITSQINNLILASSSGVCWIPVSNTGWLLQQDKISHLCHQRFKHITSQSTQFLFMSRYVPLDSLPISVFLQWDDNLELHHKSIHSFCLAAVAFGECLRQLRDHSFKKNKSINLLPFLWTVQRHLIKYLGKVRYYWRNNIKSLTLVISDVKISHHRGIT